MAKVLLGILALGTGCVFSEQLPNLTGEWDCFIGDQKFRQLLVNETEFRRLTEPFKYLDCQIGDRIRFVFNTWDRTVTLEKLVGYRND